VLDGDPAPLPKKGARPSPNFWPMFIVPNGWMGQDATWCGGRPRPKQHCVRWGPGPPPQKGGRAPQSSAHVYCGQAAAWIQMPLGTMVGLGTGNIVLGVEPAPSQGAQLPKFRPMSVVSNRLDGPRCHLV